MSQKMLASKKSGPKEVTLRLNGKVTKGKPAQQVAVARGVTNRASQPSISKGPGGLKITHREFVGSVTNLAVTGYALTQTSATTPGYDLNPACSTLFPWLSNIAPSFERFRFTNVVFRFVPSSPTTTAGRFYAAFDYDYDDPVATSKQGLMSNASAVEVPVWMETSLTLKANELHRDQPFKYVSTNSRNNYVEPRTAYCGYLMCAFDTPTANLLYDLWIDYTVEFQLPVSDGSLTITAPPAQTPVADLTSLGGGAIKYGLANLVPLIGAALKVVVPGNSITPILDLFPVAGITLRPPNAYDIRGCRKQSVLQIIADYFETGQTPSSLLVHELGLPTYAFDDKGTYLGGVIPTNSLYGPKVAGNIAVASDPIRASISFHLDDVWSQFKTAAYLATVLASTGAVGSGGYGIGAVFDY